MPLIKALLNLQALLVLCPVGSFLRGVEVNPQAPRSRSFGGRRSMTHESMTAHPGPARSPGWLARTRAAPARRRVAAGSVLAALLVAAAAPAQASGVPLRSPSPKPVPRAFFGLGPATKGKIDGRAYFFFPATPGSHAADQVAVVNFGVKPVIVRI